jgi:hypothetical protein
MPRLIVQTRDLIAGDLCVGSGERVLARPTAGVRTPRAKLDVPLRRERDGRERMATWGRYTEIAVARVDTDQPSE